MQAKCNLKAIPMTSTSDILTHLRRPRLLITAARFGLAEYDRTRDLHRILRDGQTPAPASAVARLIDEEAGLEETRRAGAATYSVARHIDVLIALMGEARLLTRPAADPVR